MKNTGFQEINDKRKNYKGSDPWYIEIALTGNCNFNCSYCNRFSSNIDIKNITKYFQTFPKCRHIQITGGEPTLHHNFSDIINLCKSKSNKVGLSTNGSYGIGNYLSLNIDKII